MLIGAIDCVYPFTGHQCERHAFETDQNFAFQGNGFAKPAVAKDKIVGFDEIHQEEFANDGFYGNGASWIGNSANSWLKIDLGRTVLIDRITFGRDRTFTGGVFNDRYPGHFTIEVALSDDVYANGDEINDGTE